ncbi:unnamed protein product [Menidia menidia]|uniref:(Atlantic silverside) hypothetical protein n=1 Tax=Menidia menidia TaxID=238744 RepID=A0A8S4AGY6_9TELE|nr:unnamed protein product [Menidia menidia]
MFLSDAWRLVRRNDEVFEVFFWEKKELEAEVPPPSFKEERNVSPSRVGEVSGEVKAEGAAGLQQGAAATDSAVVTEGGRVLDSLRPG